MPTTIHTLSASIPSTVDQGVITTLTVIWTSTASPVGFDPIVTIDWGDGENEAHSVTYLSGTYNVSYQHAFAEPGEKVVKVTVFDAVNTLPVSSIVDVQNIPPQITTVGAYLNNNTGAASFAFTFYDPGTITGYDVVIQWGDGQSTSFTVSSSDLPINLLEANPDWIGLYGTDLDWTAAEGTGPYGPIPLVKTHVYSHSIPAGYLNTESNRLPITLTITDPDGESDAFTVYPSTQYNDVVSGVASSDVSLGSNVAYNDTVTDSASSNGNSRLYRIYSVEAEGTATHDQDVDAAIAYASIVIPINTECLGLGAVPFEQLIPEF